MVNLYCNKSMEVLPVFRFTTAKHLLLAIMDFIIIGIIIYGLNDWVYDGYPKWVPYSIMVFFFIMASIRFYKFSATLKKSNPVDSHDLENLFTDDGDDDVSEIQPDAKGFRKRGKN